METPGISLRDAMHLLDQTDFQERRIEIAPRPPGAVRQTQPLRRAFCPPCWGHLDHICAACARNAA